MLIPYKAKIRQAWKDHFPASAQHVISPASGWSRRQRCMAWATLIATACAVLVPNLSYPLIEPDETRYAQIAIEMIDSRDWVTPTLDGKAYLDKPPLMYWLTALSFQLFGTTETAARLPSMLSALATILFVFGWGSRVLGRRSAWLGAMSLSLCGGFVLSGRFLILDSLLTLFTTLCLLSGYIAVRGHRRRPVWWIVSGVACALGVMTKGPVALVLCAPPLVVSGWLRADHSRTRVLHWVAFFVPMLVVCVPWYIAVAKFNSQFVDYFFWEHNYQRFIRGSNHKQPFWFYIPIVFAAMFPASLLLPSVVAFVASSAGCKRSLRSKDLGFLVCGAVWVLAFFSAASCKLPTYILPAIPLICLATGVMLDQTVFRRCAVDRITNYLIPFPQRATVMLIIACIAMIGVDAWLAGTVSQAGVLAAIVCVVVSVIVLASWNRDIVAGRSAWAGTAVVSVGVMLFASAVLLPTISSERSVYVETFRIAEDDADAAIVFFGEKPHGATFHFPERRTVSFPIEWEDEFVGFASKERNFVLVTDDARIERTRASLATTHHLTVSPRHEHVYRATRITLADETFASAGKLSR
ncbi:Undecaprenyl phosphate-alpha-4-amino-4-deoxy-L-arabinose arabinosyl transferase [Stieleria neptunia]|uniref:Undecaprenyl phosphate-alpha-4-amino-4-deoxy-L-arabinose arabinosyl transferase n=1 Tax=Stieleria neptunia TaxID=2527979 RepID=A0A518I381_9BACT|nr:glycosyltransferase family 39 protein [Stieleria neptunia]QDV47562.1 Undecaprenyl phosphate-alpha-4-amino-4-deoxy-L-arabinose arabinosyl transferase [Stieleria neptunia]